MSRVKLFAWSKGRSAVERMYIDIYAEPLADGSLKLTRSDMGPDLERLYGSYDMATSLTIPAAELPKALTAVLLDGFTKRKRLDWQRMVEGLNSAGVNFAMDSWP
jgi:hypothetical protein